MKILGLKVAAHRPAKEAVNVLESLITSYFRARDNKGWVTTLHFKRIIVQTPLQERHCA